MLRIWHLCLFAAATALGQRLDPAFDNIPFDHWLNGADDTRIHWTLRVWPAYLNEYQRLDMAITATVAGDEFVKRPGTGQLVLFMEVRDNDGHAYRSHRSLSLRSAMNSADPRGLKSAESACVLPGDYQVNAVIYDTLSGEHSVKRAAERVPELAHDRLRSAWNGLPQVELAHFCSPRDSSRLSLPLKTEKPTRVDIVVNRPGSSAWGPNLGPRIEVISELEIPNGSLQVTSLDLQRRKSLTQTVVGNLDLKRVWTGALNNRPYTVNVHALENTNGGAQFFVSEIRKLLERPVPEPQRVLIVLSEPRKFPKGEDLSPIQIKTQPGTRVFYIRCDYRQGWTGPAPTSPPPGPDSWSTPPELPSGPPAPVVHEPNNSDSLERTLKPLDPRVFHVTTAPQFREALGAIMSEISQQK